MNAIARAWNSRMSQIGNHRIRPAIAMMNPSVQVTLRPLPFHARDSAKYATEEAQTIAGTDFVGG